jgi:hypothetical protein
MTATAAIPTMAKMSAAAHGVDPGRQDLRLFPRDKLLVAAQAPLAVRSEASGALRTDDEPYFIRFKQAGNPIWVTSPCP